MRIPTGAHLLNDLDDLDQWSQARKEFLATRTFDVGTELRRRSVVRVLRDRARAAGVERGHGDAVVVFSDSAARST